MGKLYQVMQKKLTIKTSLFPLSLERGEVGGDNITSSSVILLSDPAFFYYFWKHVTREAGKKMELLWLFR